MESTFFTGLSGYGEAANFRCSCGIARRLGPPVRTGAHVGAQNGAHVGAQIRRPESRLGTDRGPDRAHVAPRAPCLPDAVDDSSSRDVATHNATHGRVRRTCKRGASTA